MISEINIINKQRRIKGNLKKLGWSINEFARCYWSQVEGLNCQGEILRFTDSLKKQLNRPSYSERKDSALDKYLVFIMKSIKNKGIEIDQKDEFQELTGYFQDYQLIIDEEENSEKREVLAVAAAYAFSVGCVFSFNVVRLNEDNSKRHYLVIWGGDIGCEGGSGTWGDSACEVTENSQGKLFIKSAEHYFDNSLRYIEEVVGYFNGELVLIGYRYNEFDLNNFPSLKYKVNLERDSKGQWFLTGEELLNKEEADRIASLLDRGGDDSFDNGYSMDFDMSLIDLF